MLYVETAFSSFDCKIITNFGENSNNKVPLIDIQQLSKLYYAIGEVAELLDVNASLLRFWEKEFKFEISKLFESFIFPPNKTYLSLPNVFFNKL
jgi:hypothetical protein